MDGILNEVTNTIHKQEIGKSALETSCGVTNNLPEDQLRQTEINELVSTTTAEKCSRCFDDGGGY